MVQEIPFFHVALNLPHAGRVARRIATLLSTNVANGEVGKALAQAIEIVALLDPWLELDDNPPPPQAQLVQEQAARLGRELVDRIEQEGLGHDRLGQCVRNYFECLELGREGTLISLRAGENPSSLQRPR